LRVLCVNRRIPNVCRIAEARSAEQSDGVYIRHALQADDIPFARLVAAVGADIGNMPFRGQNAAFDDDN
jgi:hypothetical protein